MASDPKTARDRYLVDSVLRACDVIEAFECADEVLRLRDLAIRTGMNKATAFRILTTLVERGFVERVGQQYRSTIKSVNTKQVRVGYCGLGFGNSFSQEITESLILAAEEHDILLRVLDAGSSPAAVIRNAQALIDEEVRLVIAHQHSEQIVRELADRCAAAEIPLIAIHVPHAGATYFGPDHYRSGQVAGRYAGKWAKQHWGECVDHVLLVESRKTGLAPKSYLSGALTALRALLPGIDASRVTVIDGQADYEKSLLSVRRFLRQRRGHCRTVVFGIDDITAIGAIRAFEEAGLGRQCAAVGYGGCFEARAEIRRQGSPLIASVACFPERYGETVMRLAMRLVTSRQAPPATFAQTGIITREDVDHYYAHDVLRGDMGLANLLLSGAVGSSGGAMRYLSAGQTALQ